MNSFLWETVLAFKWKILLLCCIAVLIGSTDGLIPFLVKYLFDKVIDQGWTSLVVFLLVFTFAGASRAFLNLVYIYIAATFGNLAVTELRNKLFERILRLNVSEVSKIGPSKLTSVVVNDTTFLKELLIDLVPAVIKDSVRLFALISASFYMNPVMSAFVLVAIPIIALIAQRVSKFAKKYSSMGQTEVGRLTSLTVNSLLGFKVVKAFGMENVLKTHFQDLTDRIRALLRKTDIAKSVSVPINELLATLAIAVALYWGVNQIQSGTVSKGEFFAFVVTLGLVYDPLKKLSKAKSQISANLGSLERVSSLLTNQDQDQKSKPSQVVRYIARPDIQLKDLSFCFGNNPILKELNLTIPYGKKLVIMGLSGIGKSTLADIIFGFEKPMEGSVLIGGVSADSLTVEELRSKITYVTQTPVWFEQLGLGNFGESVELDHVKEILENLQCGYLLERVKEPSSIGELACLLSGGEKQRLFLAKALCRDTDIYIFDEVTSALDPETEIKVLDYIVRRLHGKTLVFITHRESVKRYADLILDMGTGQITKVDNNSVRENNKIQHKDQNFL